MFYPSQRIPTGSGFKVSSHNVSYGGWKETYFKAHRWFVLQWMWKCINLSRNNQRNRRWWELNSSSTAAEDKSAEQHWPWRRTDRQLIPPPHPTPQPHSEFCPVLKPCFSRSTDVFCGGNVVKWPVYIMFHVVPFSLFHVKHHRSVFTVLQGQFWEETSNAVSHTCVFTAANKGGTSVTLAPHVVSEALFRWSLVASSKNSPVRWLDRTVGLIRRLKADLRLHQCPN